MEYSVSEVGDRMNGGAVRAEKSPVYDDIDYVCTRNENSVREGTGVECKWVGQGLRRATYFEKRGP